MSDCPRGVVVSTRTYEEMCSKLTEAAAKIDALADRLQEYNCPVPAAECRVIAERLRK